MSDARRRVRGRLAPEAMFPATVPDIRTRRVAVAENLSLRVAEAGDDGAPAVVLLHGWGASLYMWRAWFAPLADAGYRVVAIDLPGHGLSDKPHDRGAYSLERLAAQVRAFFRHEGLTGARTVAQSMGGTIALELALEHEPVVGPLALVNPAAFGRVPLQPLARLASLSPVDWLLGGSVPRWVVARAHRLAYADGAGVTPRDVDEYWAPSHDSAFGPAMRRLLHEFQWTRAPAERMASRLATLPTAPLVVLSGSDHLVRDARPYVDALRRAGAALELLDIPHGGHAVNEEQPELVLPRVLEHLR